MAVVPVVKNDVVFLSLSVSIEEVVCVYEVYWNCVRTGSVVVGASVE